ncbi:MAG: acetate uptake transporter [Desulfuromonadales bacterium]|nr:acetate uptake transporter [Desulfuromonadales bacterium]
MDKSVICPHYGRDEDACDVGCGYISSHDANMIIRYCSSDYRACRKFHQLNECSNMSGRDDLRLGTAITGHRRPAQAPVLGLFSYGIAACIFALAQFPIFNIDLRFLCLVIFAAAFGQVVTGLSSLKRKPLQGIAFSGIGLFWISMLAFNILPHAGYGFVPGPLPMIGYLVVWGLFSFIISQGVGDLSRICRIVFTLFMAFLMLLAIAHAISSTMVLQFAALIGIASGLPGIILGLQHLYREALKTNMPDLSDTEKAG